jgi:transcriptional regulator with XRE-family HTH domain
MTRRARIPPDDAGLPAYGGKRRVPGLRREEVALLAGISVENYTRLERGNARGASESVLEGLTRALQLNEAERTHLYDLVLAANADRSPRQRRAQRHVRLSIQRLLDSMTVPAVVQNGRLDILYGNALARALFLDLFPPSGENTNGARNIFFNARSQEFYKEWETSANDVVALLRAQAGRAPHDRELTNLVGELSTRSEDFRVRWARHDVRFHHTGTRHFHLPVVGDLTLTYEAIEPPGDPGQTIFVYIAEPNSPSQEALDLLGSWSANHPSQQRSDVSEQ